MPTYEYRCTACGEHLEVVQSFKDEALAVCPACGGPLRKVFGSIGVMFKGSGFYRTDSRPARKSETAESSSKEKSGDKSSSSEKTSSAATTEKTDKGEKKASKADTKSA